MSGLAIVGATPSADAVAVAVAACRALRRGGAEPRVHVPVAAGPGDALEALGDVDAIAPLRYATATPVVPLVAAAHHGETLDPHALLRGIAAAGGDPLLVVLPGLGPLSPLTPRYAVRDLLRELELPALVAVSAGPDALPTARLTVETLRGVGLAVPAVVLTGWPDPPDRTQRDERALLAELSGVAVHHLPTPDDARPWPVDEWLGAGARGDASSGVATSSARVLLEPYVAWEPTPQGDPRTTPRPRIMEAMLAIVAAEGPLTASRAYSLYARAGGGRKLTSVARAPLSSAIYWLAKEEKVALVRREEIPWQDDDVVRMPDSPEVRVRELGPRALDEVPLDEIAELLRRLRDARGTSDPAPLKRAVLESYGLTRMTAKADAYLDLALDLLPAPPRP